MGSEIRLDKENLWIWGSQVFVGKYHYAIAGRYTPQDIKRRREDAVYNKIGREDLYEGLEIPQNMWQDAHQRVMEAINDFYSERRHQGTIDPEELKERISEVRSPELMEISERRTDIWNKVWEETPEDPFRKYLRFIYDKDSKDFQELGELIYESVPAEIRDFVQVKAHYGFGLMRLLTHGLVSGPLPEDGIEIMVGEEVILNIQL